MKTRHSYKDYVIESHPYELLDGGWRTDIFIEEHRPNEILVTQFYLNQTLDTRDAALATGLVVGQQQIDRGFEPR
jgi:hypothetical protein